MSDRPHPASPKKRGRIRRLRIEICTPDGNGSRFKLTGDSRTVSDDVLDRYEKLCNALLRRIARHFRENAKNV